MCSNSAILCSTNSRSGILAWSDTLLHLKHYHWIRSQHSDSLTVQSIVRELLLIAFRVAFATLVGDDRKFVRMSVKLSKHPSWIFVRISKFCVCDISRLLNCLAQYSLLFWSDFILSVFFHLSISSVGLYAIFAVIALQNCKVFSKRKNRLLTWSSVLSLFHVVFSRNFHKVVYSSSCAVSYCLLFVTEQWDKTAAYWSERDLPDLSRKTLDSFKKGLVTVIIRVIISILIMTT